ncbi:uncharacterized protein EKO05_0002987 [Ascochyta rabiei]|uniref:uncharacterized protein n=1 Tax=Didymella rabiei TaxID=5454 RepID=UPI002205F59D|nr:uncharacterized protein EKO05_0002987 [Ascochyta rabiei]UPX12439.1 hypothetical protein EKO05_0002987 [Ascochyta rabiei]
MLISKPSPPFRPQRTGLDWKFPQPCRSLLIRLCAEMPQAHAVLVHHLLDLGVFLRFPFGCARLQCAVARSSSWKDFSLRVVLE